MKKVNVNLGCGVHLIKDFINVDNYFTMKDLRSKKGLYRQTVIEKGAKFVKADMRDLPFKDNSVDYIECLEAIEHVPARGVPVAIKEMYRVLKKGGRLVLFTTDFDDIAKMWVDHLSGDREFNEHNWKMMQEVIYGNQVGEGEYHRCLFNPYFLNLLLVSQGFKKMKIIQYPRGSHPPKFKGAKWDPKSTMACAFTLIDAIKT